MKCSGVCVQGVGVGGFVDPSEPLDKVALPE